MRKKHFMHLRKLHGWLHEKKLSKTHKRSLRDKYRKEYRQKTRGNNKCVFLVLTPQHTNLGDHAIAQAEIELLNSIGVNYVEITGYELNELSENYCLGVMNKCPIIINGGGNMGTLWFDVEQLMRDIIISNPKSQIVIMPNTFYYEDTEWGKKELDKSVSIYNAHKQLHIYAREKVSYDAMKSLYRDVKLVPDIVLSLNKDIGITERKGCLLCLRKDRESTITDDEKSLLLKKINHIFNGHVRITDTHSEYDVKPKDRQIELEKKFSEFRTAELVVTDRLHGMIFCAITGTPCVVINSKSPKVFGCYDWIKHLKYIGICNDLSDFEKVCIAVVEEERCFSNSNIHNYYQQLVNDLLSYIGE